MSIKIITDSTSYIPQEYIDKYDISVISLNVIMDNISEREADVDAKEFYDKLAVAGTFPKSAQPAMDEFANAFLKVVEKGDEVLGIFLSSKLSGTYSTSHLIKEMVLDKYPTAKIELIDSLNTTMSMGFMVVEAAKLANEGKCIEEIKEYIEIMRKRVDIIFIPGSLSHLRKGGRLGAAAALIGGLLKITPLLHVVDGSVEVLEKVRTHKKAVSEMLKIIKDKMDKKGLGEAVIYHILNHDEAVEIQTRVKEELGLTCHIMDIGAIIGLHVGPQSVGVAYYTKQ
ncbi:DegV family protein [uncultured Clostridium sp.]|jgi:DegV family protein with EDD domain|uniref:DegV family protein n=1 Tax=uncultured Clostridium sp. TaxID=59620 RepID=UPI00261DA034|nr:DegV family protein [uncultured Clostridium sp.]